jgi:Fic family protein
VVAIRGHDPGFGGPYDHWAYVPDPLPDDVELRPVTWNLVAAAMHALGALDQAGRQIPHPALVQRPSLRREAQSTSALEGTFAPLREVLGADLDGPAVRAPEVREVLNYVRAAEAAYQAVTDGEPVTAALLCAVHGILVGGTAADGSEAARVRTHQVVIAPPGTRVADARFVPMPPGPDLEAAFQCCVDWANGHRDLPVVVRAALVHYQFETIHPFNDGNGRIGRLLIVLQLLADGVLRAPLLAVSPWFEARRRAYQDALAALSETGNWDRWVAFFAEAVHTQARVALGTIDGLSAFRQEARRIARARRLRGVAVHLAEDLVGHPIVTPSWVARHYGVSYPAANTAIARLVEAGLLRETTWSRYARVFACDEVVAILER